MWLFWRFCYLSLLLGSFGHIVYRTFYSGSVEFWSRFPKLGKSNSVKVGPACPCASEFHVSEDPSDGEPTAGQMLCMPLESPLISHIITIIL